MLKRIFGKRYRVYAEHGFRGVKSSYRAGARVTVWFDFIATDTDYTFYQDDMPIPGDYDSRRGFRISFIMPEHDVKLTCEAHNSMMYIDAIEEPSDGTSV